MNSVLFEKENLWSQSESTKKKQNDATKKDPNKLQNKW